jgi:hypothetical protein
LNPVLIAPPEKQSGPQAADSDGRDVKQTGKREVTSSNHRSILFPSSRHYNLTPSLSEDFCA